MISGQGFGRSIDRRKPRQIHLSQGINHQKENPWQMEENTRNLLRERFTDVSVRAWKHRNRKQGAIVKFKTAGWTYTIVQADDGLAIQPENTSRNYVDYVELLLDCLIELAHTKNPIANRSQP
jgi:hypothetical protein